MCRRVRPVLGQIVDGDKAFHRGRNSRFGFERPGILSANRAWGSGERYGRSHRPSGGAPWLAPAPSQPSFFMAWTDRGYCRSPGSRSRSAGPRDPDTVQPQSPATRARRVQPEINESDWVETGGDKTVQRTEQLGRTRVGTFRAFHRRSLLPPVDRCPAR